MIAVFTSTDILAHLQIYAAYNYAVVAATLQWSHALRSFRFDELAFVLMRCVDDYADIADSPLLSGAFDNVFAWAAHIPVYSTDILFQSLGGTDSFRSPA